MVRPAVLSRERVLAAAVAVVDREGLDALSMRRLGEELGVEAMSLYRYVENKAALLDGIIESILSEMTVREADAGASWSEQIKAQARSLRATLRRHPKALSLFATRAAVTPETFAHVESALAVLRDAGFSVVDSIRALQLVLAFTVGNTLSVFSMLPADEASGPRYEALDAGRFARVREAAQALASWDVDGEFEFGLDAVVRGLDAMRARDPERKRGRGAR